MITYAEGKQVQLESDQFQSLSFTHIRDSIEHKLNILCICSTCMMAIDFFLSRFILCNELGLNIFSCWIVFIGSRVFTKTECQWRPFYFFFEQIFFIKKKNNTGIDEPNRKRFHCWSMENFKAKTHHLLLQMLSNKRNDSCIRFVDSSS